MTRRRDVEEFIEAELSCDLTQVKHDVRTWRAGQATADERRADRHEYRDTCACDYCEFTRRMDSALDRYAELIPVQR